MTQDNKPIKDGIGDVFTCRMRDISPAGDGSIMRSMILSTPYPNDYVGGGIFSHCAISGVMAAGMAANSPIYSFQWTAAALAAIRRVRLTAWATTTAFTGGGLCAFDIYQARGFTSGDLGGAGADLSGNHNKLRTSMSSSLATIQCAVNGALAPGVRTLDPAPLDRRVATIPATANTLIVSTTVFEKPMGEHPLLLATNEGFVIQATVPAVGTWQFAATTEWDEIPGY